jgi:hypothetical protein
MTNILQNILRITWIACGILFITLIILSSIQIYFITKDIRNVTNQMTIDDVHRFMGIIETQQEIQLIKDGK